MSSWLHAEAWECELPCWRTHAWNVLACPACGENRPPTKTGSSAVTPAVATPVELAATNPANKCTSNDDLVRCPGCQKKPTPVGHDDLYRCDACNKTLATESCALSLPYMVWDAHAFIGEAISQLEKQGITFIGIRSAYSAISDTLKATRWECLIGADKLLDRGVWRRRFSGVDQWYSGPSCDGQPETEEPHNFHKTEEDAFAAYYAAKNEPPEGY